MAPKAPHSIDLDVGSRVRAFRLAKSGLGVDAGERLGEDGYIVQPA